MRAKNAIALETILEWIKEISDSKPGIQQSFGIQVYSGDPWSRAVKVTSGCIGCPSDDSAIELSARVRGLSSQDGDGPGTFLGRRDKRSIVGPGCHGALSVRAFSLWHPKPERSLAEPVKAGFVDDCGISPMKDRHFAPRSRSASLREECGYVPAVGLSPRGVTLGCGR